MIFTCDRDNFNKQAPYLTYNQIKGMNKEKKKQITSYIIYLHTTIFKQKKNEIVPEKQKQKVIRNCHFCRKLVVIC